MANIRVDVTKTLTGYDGEEVTQPRQDGDAVVQVPLTYRDIIHAAIHFVSPVKGIDGRETPGIQTGEEKARVYRIATKLWGAKPMFKVDGSEQQFIVEQVVKIGYGPLVYGRVKALFGEPIEAGNNEDDK